MTSCFNLPQAPPVKDESTPDEVDNPEHVKEHEAMDFVSDKKSDEQSGIEVDVFYSV